MTSIPPVQWAALGAVFGYYLFSLISNFYVSFFLFFLTALFLVRVISSLNAESRLLRLTSLCSTVFFIGLLFGFTAAYAGRNAVDLHMEESAVAGVQGVLLEDPRMSSSGSPMAALSLTYATDRNNRRLNASGEIFAFFPQESAQRLKQFGRGTTVFIEGNVRYNDRGYSVSARSLHIVKPASAMERFRTNLRLELIDRFGNEKWSGLASALLLGVRDNLDTDLVTLYRDAGLSYILALSGMHLGIIAAIISFLLRKPLGLKGCAIAGSAIIFLYCLLVGPMPSLNRSALMYLLGVLAVLGALPKNAMSVLSLSFLIQILITPSAGNTISFILSYLALVGILIVGKALSSYFSGKVPDFLLQPLSISVGAFLATAGVCSFTFGTIAPIGIIAGLVIVPLTTIFMIGSIVWLVLDFVSLSFILNVPLKIFYAAMELTASVSGNVPPVTGGFILTLSISVVLCAAIFYFERRRREAMQKLEPFL
ncbi:MAG: ComEC/Rec2 family competence protein [Treponema sp.]|nr:ComEC/Rec2 family competence protein [Treponema sp.]MCL2237285.1 ComEC/Rec2 family competence protein [Treponema sp.]